MCEKDVFVLVILAVLVWLNYKNAYEYWTEQRLASITDITLPPHSTSSNTSQTTSTTVQSDEDASTLFLQLTVEDLGICLPIKNSNSVRCKQS